MKKLIIFSAILIIAVGGGAFYGGMKYQESKNPSFPNLTQAQRQQFSERGIERGMGPGFLSGELIDKDENSLTLKMPDGSSRIVFFSESAEISKMTQGTFNDIEIGKQITVSVDQNSDATYTAKTIQIR